MWVMLDKGFFSAVQKSGETGLTVRARVRQHLEELISFHSALAGVEIIEHEGTDYPYRIRTTHEQWAAVLAAESRGVRYSNFKGHLDKIGKGGFHDLCSKVWGVFFNASKECKGDTVRKPKTEEKKVPNCTQKHTTFDSCINDQDCEPVIV